MPGTDTGQYSVGDIVLVRRVTLDFTYNLAFSADTEVLEEYAAACVGRLCKVTRIFDKCYEVTGDWEFIGSQGYTLVPQADVTGDDIEPVFIK